ncbi:MAG: hypothetical protein INH37_06880, partial [Myxococcaceae bacterium]|nr:hypothetical protein [Myxococcaceae bacterium]
VDANGGPPTFLRPADPVLDVAPGPSLAGRPPVVLTRGGLVMRLDGGLQVVQPLTLEADAGAMLSSSDTGVAFAVLTRAPPRLYTFVVGRTPAGFEVNAPWSDCEPCPVPRLATPGVDGRGPFVDVLCATRVQRFRGALATGDCVEEPLPVPFTVAELASRDDAAGGRGLPVSDSAAPTGFLAGGLNGQVWEGPTIGAASPLLMDRVPLDVVQVGLADGTSPVFALTSAGLFDGRPERGYLALSPEGTSRIAALVNEGQTWVVTEGGTLVKAVNAGKGSVSLQYGPRLVDGRSEPVRRPLRGEAFVGADGGLVSMLVAADDSLYFVPAPAPGQMLGEPGDLGPALTPEPSSFIRSLALERTPIGSNGVDRMRGYVVTARSVFEVKLGGAPLRWSATPLTLSGGEPVEVWFDNPRGGLARVGYRDGTIFTIPGGFQLTEALPAVDGGAPVAVVDYENLGGWPVALTEGGLFVARFDALPSGRLDSRFPDGGVNRPMSWREVLLPDGSAPWRRRDGPRLGAQAAKLFVIAEPASPVSTDTGVASQRAFRLVVYLPNQVIEVGRHVRLNNSL